jgi:tRNA threonylcarbamoyladenosine biosynthesis protein TsaE
LVNEYLRADDLPVYHFDFYRIEHEEEALDMGVEEYFDSGHICLVEWPKRIAGLLPQAMGTIHIEVVNGTRVVTITAPENP